MSGLRLAMAFAYEALMLFREGRKAADAEAAREADIAANYALAVVRDARQRVRAKAQESVGR